MHRGLFSSCSEWGLLCAVLLQLLSAGASLVAEGGLWASALAAHELRSLGPWTLEHRRRVSVAHRPACLSACGIFPDQGSNLCLTLAGRFFTTEPSGKPFLHFHTEHTFWQGCCEVSRAISVKYLAPDLIWQASTEHIWLSLFFFPSKFHL